MLWTLAVSSQYFFFFFSGLRAAANPRPLFLSRYTPLSFATSLLFPPCPFFLPSFPSSLICIFVFPSKDLSPLVGSLSPPSCFCPFPSLLQTVSLPSSTQSPSGDFHCPQSLPLPLSFSLLSDSSVCPGGPQANAWVVLAAVSWLVAGGPARGKKGVRRWHNFIEQRKVQKFQLQGPQEAQLPAPGASAWGVTKNIPYQLPGLSPFAFYP